MKEQYYDLILTLSIENEKTKKDFLAEFINIKDVRLEHLYSSTYSIETNNASYVIIQLEDICRDITFGVDDIIILYGAAEFVHDKKQAGTNKKLAKIDIDLPNKEAYEG